MEAPSYTAQERRAANQVWAAAGAYGFEPLFLAHNTDGTVDFYMNTIVGLVHKYYGDKLINSIFDRWAGDLRQAMLDDLAWLYLENAAYRLELPRRPVLEALRSSHADYFFAIQYKLSRQEWMARNQLVYTMQAARWRSVLGRNLPVMTPYESGLFRALAPDTAPQPDQLQDALLAVYARFDLFDGTVHPKAALHLHLDGLLATLATKALPTQMIKTDRVTVEHSNAVDAAGSGPSVDKRQAHITLKQNAAQDRVFAWVRRSPHLPANSSILICITTRIWPVWARRWWQVSASSAPVPSLSPGSIGSRALPLRRASGPPPLSAWHWAAASMKALC